MEHSKDITRLVEIMAVLRTPGSGCSWDLAQTFETIAPYTIEEAYEVADAIERGDMADFEDELGDLLLQVVFHARIAEEQGHFSFGDVVEAITRKLIRRHPHIFGAVRDLSPQQVKSLWLDIKAAEKKQKAASQGEAAPARLLEGIASNLPALTRAAKLQAKASSVGFDWNDTKLVLDKIREETGEVAEALDGGDSAKIQDEIGDLLFATVNLARHAGIDPEMALRGGNAKFERRFGHVEQQLLKSGRTLNDTDLVEMEELWVEAKHKERSKGAGEGSLPSLQQT